MALGSTATEGRESLTQYQPALDGVRAVAVLLVVLFHLGLSWIPGGYLGVSVFFTLSGYLITSLLIGELQRSGRVSVAAFVARRARRLLPASLVCIAAVIVAIAVGEFALVPDMRASLVGAVLQVSNWVALAGSTSYRNLFASSAAVTSPLTHLWSLAIEGQFYLVWPFVIVGLWRASRRRSKTLIVWLIFLTVSFGVVAVVIAHVWGADAAYWTTPARLGELLVGATLAAVLTRRQLTSARWGWASLLGLLGVVLCSVTFPSSSGPAFRGWLTAFALLSAAIIAGLQVDGPMRKVLSLRPLVAIGRVSYGVYLFHWPVFVVLRQHGWDLTRLPGALVALAVTAALTIVSARFVEGPLRRARWRPRRVAIVSAGALAVALVAVSIVPLHRGFLEADTAVIDAAAIDSAVPAPLVTSSSSPASSTTVAVNSTTTAAQNSEVTLVLPPPPSRPIRVLVVGDSTAFYVGQGLAQWSVAHPAHMAVGLRWCQGCGFVLDGTITSFEAAAFVERSKQVVLTDVPKAVRKLHPDVVLLMSTVDDVANRQWTVGEGALSPSDVRFRDRLGVAYRTMTQSLIDLKVPHVVWVLPPIPVNKWDPPEMGDPDRYLAQHDVIRTVSASFGRPVSVVDMDGWLTTGGHAHDTRWRPDGTHLDEESAFWLVDRWLGPLLVELAQR